jgi:hypothetical protein
MLFKLFNMDPCLLKMNLDFPKWEEEAKESVKLFNDGRIDE